MEQFLNQLLESSQLPVFNAFVLGLLTAISPCPLTTNIATIAYISKHIEGKKSVFIHGLYYCIGRTAAYTLLGAVLIHIIRKGEDMFGIQQVLAQWSDRFLGPILIVIGLLIAFGHLLPLPKFGYSGKNSESIQKRKYGSFLLGVLFAMAFCPTSGLFYFGMLIPMAATENGGLLLPLTYGIATSLPVLVISWILAFSIRSMSQFMHKMNVFQIWFNRFVALIFVCVGIYYSFMMYL